MSTLLIRPFTFRIIYNRTQMITYARTSYDARMKVLKYLNLIDNLEGTLQNVQWNGIHGSGYVSRCRY